jgi:2Fe-2S ferredoxin
MPKVVYIEYDGTSHEVEVPEGWTLMQAAQHAGIDGIEGECGGSCACATCHVHVDEAFLDRLDKPNETEEKMLDGTACERQPNSRLSCQIKMRADLDGLTVRLPESQ